MYVCMYEPISVFFPSSNLQVFFSLVFLECGSVFLEYLVLTLRHQHIINHE